MSTASPVRSPRSTPVDSNPLQTDLTSQIGKMQLEMKGIKQLQEKLQADVKEMRTELSEIRGLLSTLTDTMKKSFKRSNAAQKAMDQKIRFGIESKANFTSEKPFAKAIALPFDEEF